MLYTYICIFSKIEKEKCVIKKMIVHLMFSRRDHMFDCITNKWSLTYSSVCVCAIVAQISARWYFKHLFYKYRDIDLRARQPPAFLTASIDPQPSMMTKTINFFCNEVLHHIVFFYCDRTTINKYIQLIYLSQSIYINKYAHKTLIFVHHKLIDLAV